MPRCATWPVPRDKAGTDSQKRGLFETFLCWLCISFLPPITSGLGSRFFPHTRYVSSTRAARALCLSSSEIPAGIRYGIKPCKFQYCPDQEGSSARPYRAVRAWMKSLGFHLRFWRKDGTGVPLSRPRASPWGQEGQAELRVHTFQAQIDQNLLHYCSPPTVHQGRVSQVTTAGLCRWGATRAALSKLGILGNWSATEPVPATGDTAHAKVDGEAQGEESTPCQRRDSGAGVSSGKSVLLVPSPPPFLWQWHEG